MNLYGFADIRSFRIRRTNPLDAYHGPERVEPGTDFGTREDASDWLTISDLTKHFPAKFPEKNPLNIPGPIYGADTDTCLTGPAVASANVLVDRNGQEFVFKQASHPDEFRDLVGAAMCECFAGYGADGDAHWRLSTIRSWWRTRGDMLNEGIGVQWCQPEAVEAWKRALQGDAIGYLRVYAFFVEHGRPPVDGETLPELD